MLTPTRIFRIESFDWRSIAASHPATCVCGSCQRAAEDARDYRYEHVECVTCGQRIQLIDFYGNPHSLTCAKPVIDRATLPVGVNLS
jgi:hypothetical protein